MEFLKILSIIFVAKMSGISTQDSLCPEVEITESGPCTSCPDACPDGQLCCPSSCAGGSACVSLDLAIIDNLSGFSSAFSGIGEITSSIVDPRCPDVGTTTTQVGICAVCQDPCPKGETCCPTACSGGSACINLDATPEPVCPDGLDIAFCFSPPCLTARCPRFADAQCTNDFCGQCNAIFGNSRLFESLLPSSLLFDLKPPIIIPQFACSSDSNWPQCLRTIRCTQPSFSCSDGCPRVPDAFCNLNCNCNLVFSDSRTGRTLSAEECGRVFDERCPLSPFKGFTNCSTCPRECPEEQICCPDGCLGSPSGSSCIPIPPSTCPAIGPRSFQFSCSDGNAVGSECLFFCNSNQFLIGIRGVECEENGEWSRDFESTRCLENEDLDSRCPAVQPIRPVNCPICPAACPQEQICCPTGCPGATRCIDIPVPKTCPPIGRRTFQFSCTNNNTAGSECTFRCNPNQFLIGVRRVECQENGEWSPDFEGTRCIEREDFSARCPTVQPVRPANCPVCPLTCPSGQICCPNGCPGSSNCIDVPEPTTQPSLTNCPKPFVPNMRYRCQISRSIGYFCSLSCVSGYSLSGIRIARCDNGELTPSPERNRCVRVSSSVYRSCSTCGK